MNALDFLLIVGIVNIGQGATDCRVAGQTLTGNGNANLAEFVANLEARENLIVGFIGDVDGDAICFEEGKNAIPKIDQDGVNLISRIDLIGDFLQSLTISQFSS